MTGWGRNTSGKPQGGTGQGYDFGGTSGAGQSNSGGIYHPTGSQGGGNSEVDAANIGRVSVDLFKPSESAAKAAEGIGGLFNGLRQALVGGNEQDEFGQASRDTAALGGIPVVGDLGRGVADLLGGAGEVFGGVTGAVGGSLERVHVGVGDGDQKLDAEYGAIPEDFRKQYEEAINAETGVAGTGILDNDYHFKSLAIREYAKHKALKDPTFNPGAFTAPGSLADAVTFLLEDTFGVASTGWTRFLAGVKNRAAEVEYTGDAQAEGQTVVDRGMFGTGLMASDKPVELTAVEQVAYLKMQDGTWSPDQATDFLVTNGMASHDATTSVLLALASPDLVLGFGAAGVAKLGSKGAELARTVDAAASALSTADKAVEAAQAARAATKGAKAIKAAERELDAALGAQKAAQEGVDALKVFRSGKNIRGANVLARAGEGSEGMQKVVLAFGRTYQGLEGSSLGKAAKVTRYLIDPLHGIDLKMPASSRAVDLASEVVPRTIADTAGVHHYKGVLDDLLKLDRTGRLADDFANDFGVASANFGREQLIDMFQSTQLNAGLGEELVSKGMDELFDMAYASTKERDLVRQVREATVRNVVQQTWSQSDIQTTARVLAKTYPARTAELWEAFLTKASKEQRSLLKFAGYGRLNKELLNWTADAASKGITIGTSGMDPARMVLLAKGTFTRIAAEDLLAQLAKAKTSKKRVALIREYQDRYASLRYVAVDPANAGKSVNTFTEWLSDGLDRLPMQATNDELDALENIDDIRSVLGDGYSLGFKPADEFLHGIERENGTGLYRRSGQAWVDHVADGAISYRPARVLDLNIAGYPIPAIPGVRTAAKLVDHMDSGARVFKAQVSGAMVTEVAKSRFIGQASTSELAAHGVNETLATQWWEAIQRATRQKGPMSLSGPRGMGPDQLYDVLKRGDLIPQPLLNGSRRLQPHDIMRLVLNAYDGDMRYIGLTQKLSGRVKTMLSFDGRINYAGQIAEAVWPTLKFRYNPIFQLQEKVEPWVLNAQRGVSFATGTKLTAEDAALEALLQRMTDNSLVRQADLDQFEYSSRVLFGKAMEKTAATQGSRINRITSSFGSRVFGDIQGMKRVNMLRTFQKGLGKEVRAAWEEANPGAWDQMKLDANVKAGRVITDDDFAVSLMAQNQLANDIVVRRLKGVLGKEGLTADWANAVKTGAWHTPSNLGELKGLDLEHMAASLQLVRKTGAKAGDPIDNLGGLREAIALGEVKADDITEALNVMGADPDYIRRVNNALEFHWNGFWKTATERFALTSDEAKALQDMMAGAARLRDMTPVDFMSQVFAPGIRDGQEGILGALDGHLTILRQARDAGRKIKSKEAKLAESRTVLAAKEGSTRDDLVRQLSSAFAAHLDPSAKQALLMEFRPELRKLMREGKVQFDLAELNGMWDDVANDELAARITGYMDGVEPTHPFKVIDDDARGVATVRDGATRYMEARGVKPSATRRYFEHDTQLAEDTAKAYTALPATPFERTGRKPTITQVQKASTELKPNPGVDERTYQSYQDLVVETRAQWDHMTAPKEKGGMGIKVIIARGDPYADSAAMRADVAKGRIRVFASDSDHPLMTNEQNVMFRAVHDVFGHAAEGYEFGPRGELNAAIKHSQMYSDTGRAAMLSETHGQNSWVNFSDDLVPSPEQAPLPTTIDEFEDEFPFELPDSYKPDPDDKDFPAQDDFDIDVMVTDEFGNDFPLPVTIDQRIGDGFEALAPEAQGLMLGELARLQRSFPDFKVFHFDVVDDLHLPYIPGDGGWGLPTGVRGVTWGADDGEAVVLMDASMFEGDFAANEARALSKNESFRTADIKKTEAGELPRESPKGTAWNAGSGAAYTLRHEYGHVLDSKLRPVRSWTGTHKPQRMPENEAYFDFMEEFDASPARGQLAEYAFNETQDSAAELFALAFDPNLDRTALEPELSTAVDAYRKLLADTGHFIDSTPNPHAGKTVREVNAATPGAVYAEQKAALLPQDILDRFGAQYVGRGKHVESNPDVARTAQYFGKWTESVVRNGLLKGDSAQYRGILDDIAGLPTEAGVPYNHTEAMALNLATQSMARKWDDAFRLQYFSQERTMLERSINHPMFGLYPASYMWGKIAPELIRFIASEPFGIKTGGLLYGAMDAQAAIALRREYDPEFDYAIEKLGHSQALSFLGFLLPSLPWDVGASAPAWMRGIAQQGASQEKAIAAGNEPEDLSMIDAVGKSVDQAFPYKRNAAWAGEGIGELQKLVSPEELTDDQQAEKDKWVQAAELEAPLAEVMAELRAALSR